MREQFFRLEIVFILIAAGLLLRMVPLRVSARPPGAARSPEPLPASSPEARQRALSLGRPIADFVARTGGGR